MNRSIARGLAVLVTVALLAFLAAACGSGGGGDKTPQVGDTPQAEQSPQADGGNGGGDGGGGGGDGVDDGTALGDLSSLAAEAAEGVTAKVTYKYTSDVDGEVTEGEWVLVQRPPDSRFELSTMEGGEEIRTISIITGGKIYTCTAVAGQESCFASEADETGDQTAAFDPLFDIPRQIAEDSSGVNVVDQSTRSIAGVDATCFTTESTLDGPSKDEVCFSEGGILLFLRNESDGDSYTFEATSASTDVTDEDFVPPYEILEIPDIGDLEIPQP